VSATNLPSVDTSRQCDPYISVSLIGSSIPLQDSSGAQVVDHNTDGARERAEGKATLIKAQAMTSVKSRTTDPVWNEMFSMVELHPDPQMIPPGSKTGELSGQDVQVFLTLHDRAPSGSSTLVGWAALSLKSGPRKEESLTFLDRHGRTVTNAQGKPSTLTINISYDFASAGSVASQDPTQTVVGGSGSTAFSPPFKEGKARADELPPNALLPWSGSKRAVPNGDRENSVTKENCKIGELLWVLDDPEVVKRFTDQVTGISWNPDMAEVCGTQGEVVAVLDNYVGMRFQAWVSWCFVYGALERRSQ